jgi:large conductance mechanosensitive channel
MLKEFKEFALRGNVVDLAVGVIIGAAFGTIVSSLVDDVVMPPIGLLLGGIDFSQLAIPLKPAELGPDGAVVAPAVAISYGKFINALIKFAIVAWVIFLLVKGMNQLTKKETEAPAAPPPPPEEVVLLREIRDSLKK